MARQDGLREFRDLRAFAMEEILRILQKAESAVGKAALHRRVEERFRHAHGGWPKELDRIGRNGCRRGTNAIAWALAALTSRRVIRPCLGANLVRLEDRPEGRAPQPLNEQVPDRESIEARVRARAQQAISRAAAANMPFDQSFVQDSVRAVREAGYRCAMTGRAFDIEYRTRGAGGTHYAPSPDRIVPELGYVRGNVRWILWCLNRGKGEMSAEDYVEVCRLVAGFTAEDFDEARSSPRKDSLAASARRKR
jgi:hypothetical protein